MKFYIKWLFLSFLMIFIISCSTLFKGKRKDRDQWRTTTSLEDQTYHKNLEGDTSDETSSSRRSVSTPSGIEQVVKKEKDAQALSDQEETKSVSIFEPYDPDKEIKKEEEIKETPEGELPEKIKKELLGEDGQEEEYVTLNFEQAPIEEILNAVSETLGINFIMTPGVKGAITMQTSKPVPSTELFQILQSVLEVNNLTLVKSGRYFKVVLGKDAKQYPLKVLSGKEGEELPFEDTFITQIIPLDYIPVKDMVSILQPFLSKSAPPMIQHEELNILIINDLASNMKRLLRFVQELDKPLYQPKEKVYVYYVENGDAEKLASTLNSIYKGIDKTKYPFATPVREKPEAQPEQQAIPQPQQQMIPTPFGPYFPSEEVTGEVRITADKEINALIIVCSPRDYPAILETVKKLDIMPKQVLIEALVLDVTLSDITSFGIGWYLRGSDHGVGFGFNESEIPTKDSYLNNTFGETFGYKMITDNNRFMAVMQQISNFSHFNVISSPYIMALDNNKASINISREYAIEDYYYDSQAETYYPRTSYKKVGLKLDITPKINESNMLTLEIGQEVSERAREGEYNIREVDSKVVVKDGQTIVIGGLIQENKDKVSTGIPFLSEIPLVGRLFGRSDDSIQKTELILLMTPHIISNQEDVEEITTEFNNRVESLKELSEKVKR